MDPIILGIGALALIGVFGGLWVVALITGSSPTKWFTLGGALGGGGLFGIGGIITKTYTIYSASISWELGLAGMILLVGTGIFILVLGWNAWTDWRKDRPIRLVK